MLAHFYWLSDSIEQARMLVERVVRSPENDQNAQALLGWLMISQKDDEYGLGVEDEIDDAISIFDSVLEEFPFLEVTRNMDLKCTASFCLTEQCAIRTYATYLSYQELHLLLTRVWCKVHTPISHRILAHHLR